MLLQDMQARRSETRDFWKRCTIASGSNIVDVVVVPGRIGRRSLRRPERKLSLRRVSRSNLMNRSLQDATVEQAPLDTSRVAKGALGDRLTRVKTTESNGCQSETPTLLQIRGLRATQHTSSIRALRYLGLCRGWLPVPGPGRHRHKKRF